MKTIAAAKFRALCLALLDHLEPEGFVITKHGKPVARLLPIERSSAELIGSLRDAITVNGDLLSTGTCICGPESGPTSAPPAAAASRSV
jgi:antitoxin (DNA-binding transcriptional repressor) of toxin-antitoxin stability system